MEMTPRDDMGVVWMGDMLLSNDSSNMMDTQSDFFTDSPNSIDEVRSRVPLEMVDDYLMMNENESYCGVSPPRMNSMSTQTQTVSPPSRKIKPVKHPGLKLKTPIAFQKDSDPNIIPIEKDGMAICEKCGAIGVKHAFYTKERRFCSLMCAREFTEMERRGQPIPKPYPIFNLSDSAAYRHSSLAHQLEDPPSPVSKTCKPLVTNTYEWKNQLSEPGFIAAPVSCFKHAPMADSWDNITVGMKVEVENTDCDDFSESFPDSFWVATVLKIAGYNALLRYEGFGQNCSKDFWVNLCSSSVHPVGWCATRGKPLIPPKTIEDKYKDWKEFLVKRLTGARTLPFNFYARVTESLSSRFRCGMNLEVVDKNRISRVKVATIRNIVGKRLHVMYYNAEPDDNGFWCHEDSPLIHPVGWAHRVGQALSAPRTYLERCEQSQLVADDATDGFFVQPRALALPLGVEFKKGMKLEAVDPLNLSSICVATVMKVLKENYIMIRIDSYDEDVSGSDWFCYHASSPCVFPPGFCHKNSIALTPPKGYESTDFEWEAYLAETGAPAAPQALFTREVPAHGFVVGTRLEAADIMDPRLVCVGTVSRVVGRLLKVHFDGWEEEYDQWLDCDSPDVYPVGWCDLVGHKLEGPRGSVPGTARSSAPGQGKGVRGVKKKARRRHAKRSPGAAGSGPSSVGGGSAGGSGGSSGSTGAGTGTRGRPTTRLPGETNKAAERVSRELFNAADEVSDGELPEPALAGPSQSSPTPPVAALAAAPAPAPSVTNPPALAPASEQTPSPVAASASLSVQSCAAGSGSASPASSGGSRAASGTSGKAIPRLVAGAAGNRETGGLVPAEWNVFDVAQFLRVNDCAAYCDSFQESKIDGSKLLVLTKDQIVDLTGMKVGPSLKIFDLIQQLRIKVNPAQERMKAGLKKFL